jgi:large subunit ribosomal protein L21
MFAVFQSGGKQHRVRDGEVLALEKLDAGVGDRVTFDRVLMLGGDDRVVVGTPFVAGGRVDAEVLEHGRGDKVRIVKFRRRKHYMRRQGHRQWFTKVRITAIGEPAPGAQ